MASQNLNVGTAANANDGDTLRAAFIKVKQMFAEIYGQTYSEQGDLSGVTFEIDEDQIKASNSAVDGYVLTYNSSTGGFTWKEEFDGDITSIVAGAGLTGSSLDTDDATLNVIGGDGITVNADEVEATVDGTTIELSATDGTGALRVKDDGIDYDKLAGEFTSKATIPSDYDVDFSAAAVFEDTMDAATIAYDIENPKVGDVKTLVLTGDGTDRTISFEMSGSTGETFNKMKGSDAFSFTSADKNLVQIICVSDTANSEVFWYSNSVVAS